MNTTFTSFAITALSISIAAIFGVLVRIQLNVYRVAQVAPIFDDILANVFGCFFLGIHDSIDHAFALPTAFSRAWSTGFAGSVTTFASWNYQVSRMLVRGSWFEGLRAIFIGICTAFCAFFIGKDVGTLCTYLTQRTLYTNRPATPNHASPSSTRENSSTAAVDDAHERVNNSRTMQIVACSSLCVLFALSLGGCIAGALLDRDMPQRRSNWASAMFAPLGAVVRWRLSVLNSRLPRFPLGTFLANMLAVVLDLAVGAALLVRAGQLSDDTVLFLLAIITGLGGSLSTVSTWILEAVQLDTTDRYMYILGSIGVAQLLGLVIYGPGFYSILRS